MRAANGVPGIGSGCRSAPGFSLLELVVVIAIISVLLVFAITGLWALQAEAERVAMEQVIGSIQSAIGIEVAQYMVTGNTEGIRALEGSNPMDRLAEVPKNYLGTLSDLSPANMTGGAWYFDLRNRTLVYRVRNTDHFRGGSGVPAQVRFIMQLEYEGRNPNGVSAKNRSDVSGARLVPLEPYSWVDVKE